MRSAIVAGAGECSLDRDLLVEHHADQERERVSGEQRVCLGVLAQAQRRDALGSVGRHVGSASRPTAGRKSRRGAVVARPSRP